MNLSQAQSSDLDELQEHDFRQGYLDTLPLWLGAFPFGVVYAVSALNAGLTSWQTILMSLIVYAGAAQFTAVGLFAAGASPISILITTAIINARHLLLATTLVPYLRKERASIKALIATQLTDESFAIGMSRFIDGKGSTRYQFGSNLSMYTVWQLSTILGVLIGEQIPNTSDYGLDLVFPFTFIGLLVPLLKTHINRTVAACAAVLAIVGALVLPGSWYLLFAGIAASGIGCWLSLRQKVN